MGVFFLNIEVLSERSPELQISSVELRTAQFLTKSRGHDRFPTRVLERLEYSKLYEYVFFFDLDFLVFLVFNEIVKYNPPQKCDSLQTSQCVCVLLYA